MRITNEIILAKHWIKKRIILSGRDWAGGHVDTKGTLASLGRSPCAGFGGLHPSVIHDSTPPSAFSLSPGQQSHRTQAISE